MFDECAGNFSHKRLKAVIWLVVVVAFFAAVRQFYISRMNQDLNQTEKSTQTTIKQ